MRKACGVESYTLFVTTQLYKHLATTLVYEIVTIAQLYELFVMTQLYKHIAIIII
jgi:hypothetical protein